MDLAINADRIREGEFVKIRAAVVAIPRVRSNKRPKTHYYGRERRFSEDADKRAVRVVQEARVIYWALYARFIGP